MGTSHSAHILMTINADLRDDLETPAGGKAAAGWCEAVRQARLRGRRISVVMRLFAGPGRDWGVQHYLGRIMMDMGLELLMVAVDLAEGSSWDLSRVDTFEQLWSLVEEGLVDVILGGPPRSAWSRARFWPGAPRPLRRRGKCCWAPLALA